MKMIMGVSRNIPDYILRREMARNKMATTTLKRVFKFIIRMKGWIRRDGRKFAGKK